ncbi:hypothetical protein MasN3_23570 [Massilia varians]|uniref:DUF11 domain-containing protein n=1 Tax=Massilia varians TaxID=457921 RepID=A0ABM8C6L0_9BURK|nr:DUF6701 domain-containing protein [Massilia varians]BDT58863.1 hypothetical protein MasN3_23570 [Massilia varians]
MKTPLTLSCIALCAGLAAWSQPAAATALVLTKTFEGNINFAGTQASLQSKAGGAKACDLTDSAQASISLPSGAEVVSATLYWAGTGAIDGEVSMNGAAVSAPVSRRYASSIDGFTYFSAAAEVTSLVQGKTSFTFGGLTVDTSETYCSKKQKENSMVAGFALVVVYAQKNERYRTVNVYEGLQALKYNSVTVKMPDYTPPADNAGSGRFGYIVWEGDKTGNQKGDEVRFAGALLRAEPFIQKQNAFNSKSGANADENSIGIDFDVVDLPAPPARPLDANAVFTTESDRVLLGTAIVALPSKPADLAIRKTQAGEFKLGNEITYTLTVSNEGARADNKVQVTDTLPAALAYVSAGGLDWTCAVAGQTVTCKYGKALAPGASASLQVKGKITAEGRIVNTAEVSGTADGVPGNNKSTVEGDTGGGEPVNKDPYVFTVGACQPNEKIKASGDGCALFAGPVVAGIKPTIYLTRAENGTAKPFSTTASTVANLYYSLECNNPARTANTAGSYGVALSTCVPHGTPLSAGGAPATPTFAANTASTGAEFHYPDVGLVTLRVRDAAGNTGRVSFASVPERLEATFRRPDGVANPGTAALDQPGFAEAGEPFQVVVSARGYDGVGPLKNFGNESGEFALAERLQVLADGGDLAQKRLVPQNAWEGSAAVQRSFAWNEVGAAMLGVSLDKYLGVKSLSLDPVAVGRFYPQYFKTETEKGFGCLKRMNCPGAAPHLIARAVYSGQPFTVTVTAYGRNGQPLQGFVGPLVPDISLAAVSVPGKDGKPPGSFVNGEGRPATVREDVRFQLEVGYDATKATRGWTPPTAVHLRATASELRKTADGAVPVTISSRREEGIVSLEGGIMVVNGRLMVNNVIGTPLARTPVPLQAQFWSGAAWEHNTGLEQTEALQGKVHFTACRRSLRTDTETGACDPSIKVLGTERAADPFTLPLFKDGKASLVLAPLAADKSGTVDLFIDAADSLPYLPSTIGRISFGQFKSPVIYVREMY